MKLDTWFACVYGLTRDELRYILDPADVHGPGFPGETVRVLKQKEEEQFGEYRTRWLVLETWDPFDVKQPHSANCNSKRKEQHGNEVH